MTDSPPTSALMFRVSPSSGEPIYRQLMDQIERLIVGKQLNAGDRLPSVRDVAAELEVNPMTVSKAYSMMEAAGWLSRLRGKGMIVSALASQPEQSGDATDLLRPAVEELVAQASQAGIARSVLLKLVSDAMQGDDS